MFWIYALLDEKGFPRYVGKTYDLKERLRNHLKEKGRCHRICWLKSMKSKGLNPTLIALDSKPTEQEALDEEVFLISYFRYLGADLTNGTDGGEGISGHKHSLETRNKMSKSRIGHITSPETRRKLSESNKGKPHKGGWHHNETSKKKITGRKPRQIQDSHGKVFASVREAAKVFGVSIDQIKYALQKGTPTHKVPRLHYVEGSRISTDAHIERFSS